METYLETSSRGGQAWEMAKVQSALLEEWKHCLAQLGATEPRDKFCSEKTRPLTHSNILSP